MKRIINMILMTVAAITAATSCGIDNNGPENTATDLTISVDTPVIRSDGKSAAKITVKLGDEVVTDGVTLYDAANDSPADIPGMTFTTTEPGIHSFWATYKTFHTKPVSITAITSPIPELPADSKPAATDFARKVFITQFTGTGCQFCPNMISLLEKFAENNEGKFVLAACHTFNNTDPAFIDEPIDNAMAISGYPNVVLDLDKSRKFADYTKPARFAEMFEDEYADGKSDTGISVASVLDGNNLVVKAKMKVAKDGKYRLAAWLLEDGIEAKQSGSSNPVDIHDNCVRLIMGKNSASDFTGSRYMLEAGESVEEFFLMTLDSKWKSENCHIVVFACTENGLTYTVNNVVDCPAGSNVAFSYIN